MENIVNEFDFSALPIKVDYVGKAVDTDDGCEWPHFLWNVTISYKSGFWAFPYKCGMGHIEKKPGALPMPNPPYRKGTIAYAEWEARNTRPKKPSNSDIMYSILTDAEAGNLSFNEWCDNYGYSNDSVKAFNTYQTCCEYAVFIRKVFTSEQVSAMQKALEDY